MYVPAYKLNANVQHRSLAWNALAAESFLSPSIGALVPLFYIGAGKRGYMVYSPQIASHLQMMRGVTQ